MGPGARTMPQFYGDDRVVWVVWSGQIRFTIDGQKPFIAKKGFLVQVPYRVAYSMGNGWRRACASLRGHARQHAALIPLLQWRSVAAKPATRL